MRRQHRIRQRPTQDGVVDLVERIAERSYRDVLQRIGNVTKNMSAEECRGYIRARAASVVQLEVERVIRQHPQGRSLEHSRLLRLAMEAVMVFLIRDGVLRGRQIAA